MNNKIGKFLFVTFISLGIISFSLMFLSLFNSSILSKLAIENGSYSFLSATFILLSSLIAAFSVNRTVINTREMKENETVKEEQRNEKILKIGKDFLLKELVMQSEFFNSLKDEITNSEEKLENLNTVKYFYSDLTNENKIISQLDYLLNIELHNYTEKDVLSVFFEIKGDVLIIIHFVNVLKNIHILNNNVPESLNIIDEVFDVINSIEEKINSINF